jgi:hypothetical protein
VNLLLIEMFSASASHNGQERGGRGGHGYDKGDIR